MILGAMLVAMLLVMLVTMVFGVGCIQYDKGHGVNEVCLVLGVQRAVGSA